MAMQGVNILGNYSPTSLYSSRSQTSGDTLFLGSQNSSAQGADYGRTSTATLIRQRINSLLADIPPEDDGRITFTTIKNHKEKLQTEFEEDVKAALKESGIDENIEFTLKYNQLTKDVQVVSEHAEKDRVVDFFNSNPEYVERFANIETMGSLTRVVDSKATYSEMKHSLQLDAVKNMLDSTGDGFFSSMESVLMRYQEGSISGLPGLSRMV